MDANNKKKLITWAIVIAIALVVVYFIFFKKKKEDDVLVGTGVTSTFPLKKGSEGKEVEQLQMYLLKNYGAQFPFFGIDGKWGDETEANVKKFLMKDNVSKDSYDKWNLALFTTTKFK